MVFPSPAAAVSSARVPEPRAATPVSIALATGDSALDLLDDRWDELVRRQPLPNPTLTATWLRRLARWRTGTPLVAVADSGAAIVAGAALELRRPAGRLGPLVGTWLGPAEQLCSPDLLVEPGRPEVGAELLAAVFDEVHVLHVAAPARGPAAAAFAEVAPWRRADEIGRRWVVSWPPARHAYARHRAAYEIRWARRRGARVEERVTSEPDEVARALVRLFRIHRDRWHGRDDLNPRFAGSGRHRAWNREVVAALAAAGRVRIAEVLEDGRPLAACIGFVEGRGGVAHTQAMRTDGTLREPGHIALLRCVEALGEAGATAVDLSVGGGGGGGPKARMGSEPEPVLALLAADSAARQRPLRVARRLVAAARRVSAA